jgi:5'-nucleotidase (lipoprotein e(P4) family)
MSQPIDLFMKLILKFVRLAVLLAAALPLTSCQTAHRPVPAPPPRSEKKPPADQSDRILANLWFRYAAECRALYYQAYNVATDRLSAAIAARHDGDHLAVIMDIDETILDNSPFHADLIQNGQTYTSQSWREWAAQFKAQALPGALAFLNYAAKNHVDVFYVSNRPADQPYVTERNLRDQGFPMVDADHVLLQQSNEGKEPKRKLLFQKYKVVLLRGDNLGDFSKIFDKQSLQSRFDLTDKNRDNFGHFFIVLPNPMYGDWESALYQALTEEQKATVRRELLRSWR